MSTRKVKLPPKKAWHDYADTAVIALTAFVIAMFLLGAIVAWNKVDPALEITEPAAEGPGKTWKEPGSARDTFNENFSR